MVFSSTVFLFLFFPLTLLVYYNPFVKGRKFKNYFLLLASLMFYAWGEPLFVFLMMFSIVVTWWFGRLLSKNKSRKILSVAIVYHVMIIFVFKYLGFFFDQISGLFQTDALKIDISLPIGISFFTFQMMSYLFDIYYGRAKAQGNPLFVGLYISLFPQLIAGPIVRYDQIENEISNRRESFDDIVIGMQRFIYGLGKKVLIANYVAQIADDCFDYFVGRTVAMAWLGAICYTWQIYFDFSGYSDMAIGLGRMFGFHFAENFNYPYISRNVTEFWRRWHISLSSWFRDYVYIPLGGNRVGKKKWIFNLFVVWLLTGIWHGANWTFLLWGLLYFVVLIIEKETGLSKKANFLTRIYTMVVVIFAWVIFRSETISDGISYIGNMIGLGSGLADSTVYFCLKNSASVLMISLFGTLPCYRKMMEWMKKKGVGWIEQIWLLVVLALSVLKIISNTYNPFIYFNF